jgi:hypothetical protein
VWQGAARHFAVALTRGDAARRIAARQAWLPPLEREYWDTVRARTGPPPDTLRFLALSLDGQGRPIPIVNTDPAMSLLLEPLSGERVRALVSPIMRGYPVGLFVEDLGPLVANDSYATREVWDSFRRDAYHGPTVVWGRDVNLLLAGLATQMRDAPTADAAFMRDALERTITGVQRSGLRHAELWSYRIENGKLLPIRYGTSSDVQLWSLTDLAVQYLLNQPRP